MEKAIAHSIKITKVKEIKNPTVVMNNKDFEKFIKELESKGKNIKPDKSIIYKGLPIIGSEKIEEGIFIIYDDITDISPK